MFSRLTVAKLLLGVCCCLRLLVQCQGVCPPPPVIPHTTITQDGGRNPKDFVFYACTPHQAYEEQFDIFRRIECLDNGSWSRPYPACKLTTYEQCDGQEWRHYGFNSRYSAASEQCVQDGGTLSNIRSDSDRTCARQVIPADFHDGFSEYWIGVEDRDGDGVYQWLSDNRTEPTNSNNWNVGQTIVPGQCGFYRVGHRNQLSRDCLRSVRGYLCMRPIPKFITCNGSEWHYSMSDYHWEHAEAECQQQGGHLANIRTERDRLCGLEVLRGTTAQNSNIIVGLFRNDTTNAILWISDSAIQAEISPLWRPGQPFPTSQCGFWTPSLGIGLGSCSPRTYICQRSLRLGPSPTTPAVTNTTSITAQSTLAPVTTTTPNTSIVSTTQTTQPAATTATTVPDISTTTETTVASTTQITLLATTSSTTAPQTTTPEPTTEAIMPETTSSNSTSPSSIAGTTEEDGTVTAAPVLVTTSSASSSVTGSIWFIVLVCVVSALVVIVILLITCIRFTKHGRKSYRGTSWLTHRSDTSTTNLSGVSTFKSLSIPDVIIENSQFGSSDKSPENEGKVGSATFQPTVDSQHVISSRKPTIIPRPDWTLSKTVGSNSNSVSTCSRSATPLPDLPTGQSYPIDYKSSYASPTSDAADRDCVFKALDTNLESNGSGSQMFYASLKATGEAQNRTAVGDGMSTDTSSHTSRAVAGQPVAKCSEVEDSSGHDSGVLVTGDCFSRQILNFAADNRSCVEAWQGSSDVSREHSGDIDGSSSSLSLGSEQIPSFHPVQVASDNEHLSSVPPNVAPAYCSKVQRSQDLTQNDLSQYLPVS